MTPAGDQGYQPRHQRRRVPKKVTLALAALMAAVALLVGIALGYTARGGSPPAPLETVERDLPVVTVTEPQ